MHLKVIPDKNRRNCKLVAKEEYYVEVYDRVFVLFRSVLRVLAHFWPKRYQFMSLMSHMSYTPFLFAGLKSSLT